MGYEVLEAQSGKAAVELAKQHGDRISIIVLDLTMPDMSGPLTFEALRPHTPKSRVLLSSGFSADGQVQALLAQGCSDFIQKPYDMAQLSQKLRKLR
jgi:two-component system cell cycle sensor histidine kinase/response regulator CckA